MAGPKTTEHQCKAQNATQYTTTLPTSILIDWTYYHRIAVAGPRHHTVNPHPSDLHPSIMSNKILFRDFMDVVKNSSVLRACASRYNVCSRIIKNLLDEYESHQISRTRQEKEPLVDTNNQNHITGWAQEQIGLNYSNQTYTDWELLTACKIQVLCNTSYDQLKSVYVIPKSTNKRYLEKVCPPLQCRNVQHVHRMLKKGEV